MIVNRNCIMTTIIYYFTSNTYLWCWCVYDYIWWGIVPVRRYYEMRNGCQSVLCIYILMLLHWITLLWLTVSIHNNLGSNQAMLILNWWYTHISRTQCNMSHFMIKLFSLNCEIMSNLKLSTIGQLVEVDEYFHIHFTHYQYLVIQIYINIFNKK